MHDLIFRFGLLLGLLGCANVVLTTTTTGPVMCPLLRSSGLKVVDEFSISMYQWAEFCKCWFVDLQQSKLFGSPQAAFDSARLIHVTAFSL